MNETEKVLNHLTYILNEHKSVGASFTGLHGNNAFTDGYLLAIKHAIELVEAQKSASQEEEGK
jgi:hypothetical protein